MGKENKQLLLKMWRSCALDTSALRGRSTPSFALTSHRRPNRRLTGRSSLLQPAMPQPSCGVLHPGSQPGQPAAGWVQQSQGKLWVCTAAKGSITCRAPRCCKHAAQLQTCTSTPSLQYAQTLLPVPHMLRTWIYALLHGLA